jgi:hypothetical protein
LGYESLTKRLQNSDSHQPLRKEIFSIMKAARWLMRVAQGQHKTNFSLMDA